MPYEAAAHHGVHSRHAALPHDEVCRDDAVAAVRHLCAVADGDALAVGAALVGDAAATADHAIPLSAYHAQAHHGEAPAAVVRLAEVYYRAVRVGIYHHAAQHHLLADGGVYPAHAVRLYRQVEHLAVQAAAGKRVRVAYHRAASVGAVAPCVAVAGAHRVALLAVVHHVQVRDVAVGAAVVVRALLVQHGVGGQHAATPRIRLAGSHMLYVRPSAPVDAQHEARQAVAAMRGEARRGAEHRGLRVGDAVVGVVVAGAYRVVADGCMVDGQVQRHHAVASVRPLTPMLYAVDALRVRHAMPCVALTFARVEHLVARMVHRQAHGDGAVAPLGGDGAVLRVGRRLQEEAVEPAQAVAHYVFHVAPCVVSQS